jgi:hypothetical protein
MSMWSKPIGETKITMYFRKDVAKSTRIKEVMDCISALGPAIEIADLDSMRTDPGRFHQFQFQCLALMAEVLSSTLNVSSEAPFANASRSNSVANARKTTAVVSASPRALCGA